MITIHNFKDKISIQRKKYMDGNGIYIMMATT